VFLDDGRLALTMALPSQAGNAGNGMLDEAWIFDPARGSLVPFTTPSNPQAARVVVSPDGSHVAYAQPRQTDIQAGPATPRLTDVMVAAADDARPVRVFTQCPEAWYLCSAMEHRGHALQVSAYRAASWRISTSAGEQTASNVESASDDGYCSRQSPCCWWLVSRSP